MIQPSYKPHDMYHANLSPVLVETQDQHDKLAADGWTDTYQHQPFPTTLYREVEQKDKNGTVIEPLIQSQQVTSADHGLGPDWIPFEQLPSVQARVAAAPPIAVRSEGGDMKPVDSGVQTTEPVEPAFTKNVVVPDALKEAPAKPKK